jgi:hypothetical protein
MQRMKKRRRNYIVLNAAHVLKTMTAFVVYAARELDVRKNKTQTLKAL